MSMVLTRSFPTLHRYDYINTFETILADMCRSLPHLTSLTSPHLIPALTPNPTITTPSSAYVRKAKALLAQGNASEAIAAYTQCLVKDPGNAAVAKEKKETEEAVQRLALARQCLAEEKYTQTWRQIEIVEKVGRGSGVGYFNTFVSRLGNIMNHNIYAPYYRENSKLLCTYNLYGVLRLS